MPTEGRRQWSSVSFLSGAGEESTALKTETREFFQTSQESGKNDSSFAPSGRLMPLSMKGEESFCLGREFSSLLWEKVSAIKSLIQKESNEHFLEARYPHFTVKSKCNKFILYLAKICHATNHKTVQYVYLGGIGFFQS